MKTGLRNQRATGEMETTTRTRRAYIGHTFQTLGVSPEEEKVFFYILLYALMGFHAQCQRAV